MPTMFLQTGPATQTARATADAVSRQLVQAFECGGECFIQTPLMYPGGSTVVVSISVSGDHLFLSDFGLGFQEAELIGANRHYTRIAPKVGERYGVHFDHHAFFVAEVSRSQAAGAVMALANASKETVDWAALRYAEKRERDQADALIDRLLRVFNQRHVHRDAEVRGASSHPWHPTALVERGERRIIFNQVRPAAPSVYATVSMFHDIARMSDPMPRVAVAPKKRDLGDYETLLAQAGAVTDLETNDDTFVRIAA